VTMSRTILAAIQRRLFAPIEILIVRETFGRADGGDRNPAPSSVILLTTFY
jgi:hypothetical protein